MDMANSRNERPKFRRARVVCRCGSVEITFVTSAPRFAAECCISDCYAELTRLERLGGPTLPESLRTKQKPIGQVSFPNCMKVKGKEKLIFFTIKEKRYRTWMVCSSCLTHLVWHHGYMQGNAVAVYTDLGTLVDVDMPPRALRWFEVGWPGNMANLDASLPSVWFDSRADNITGSGPWQRAMADTLNTVRDPVNTEGLGEGWSSLADLIKESGRAVEELDEERDYGGSGSSYVGDDVKEQWGDKAKTVNNTCCTRPEVPVFMSSTMSPTEGDREEMGNPKI